jgi:general secretion pathway protein H
MLILAVGSLRRAKPRQHLAGFTLLELLVVLAIVAIVSAGVGLALRDGTQTRLERESQRLSALFESARARSQVGGVPVRWRVMAQGFRFDDDLPQEWLDPDTSAYIEAGVNGETPAHKDSVLLGPDPIIEPQVVVLLSRSQASRRVRMATDGVRAFAVQEAVQ